MPTVFEGKSGKTGKLDLKNITGKNTKVESENESEDSSDYESKSAISERNITKARGGNNAVYGDQSKTKAAKAPMSKLLAKGVKVKTSTVIKESP